MDRVPLIQTWGKILSNFTDAAPLLSHQVQVAKHVAELEGGGADACR